MKIDELVVRGGQVLNLDYLNIIVKIQDLTPNPVFLALRDGWATSVQERGRPPEVASEN